MVLSDIMCMIKYININMVLSKHIAKKKLARFFFKTLLELCEIRKWIPIIHHFTIEPLYEKLN